MKINKSAMQLYRAIKQHEALNYKKETPSRGLIISFFLALVFWLVLFVGLACAEPINIDKLANAIYKAEGGAKTTHPYGILKKYKTTTPRQACINTIKHALKDWNKKGDFLAFLASRYAPIGVTNDPKNLNKNWYFNVKTLYSLEKQL